MDFDKAEDESVDTTSIIESKEALKEYWERRMMADQGLLPEEEQVSLKREASSPSSPVMDMVDAGIVETRVADHTNKILNQIKAEKRNYVNVNVNVNGNSGKLGSDGESEASPECSLSPVEVDSLEEGESEGRQSPEGRDEDVLLESLHQLSRECLEKEVENLRGSSVVSEDIDSQVVVAEENEKVAEKEATDEVVEVEEEGTLITLSSTASCTSSTTITTAAKSDCHEQVYEAENAGTILERDDDLPTVVEEETDSLEEFIKHENECMKAEHQHCSLNDGISNKSLKTEVEPLVACLASAPAAAADDDETPEKEVESVKKVDSVIGETNESHHLMVQPRGEAAKLGGVGGSDVGINEEQTRDSAIFTEEPVVVVAPSQNNVQLEDKESIGGDVGEATPTEESLLVREREPSFETVESSEAEGAEEVGGGGGKVDLPVVAVEGNLLDLDIIVDEYADGGMRQEKENVYEEIPSLKGDCILNSSGYNQGKSLVEEIDCQIQEDVPQVKDISEVEGSSLATSATEEESVLSSDSLETVSNRCIDDGNREECKLEEEEAKEDGKESLKPQIVGQTYQSVCEEKATTLVSSADIGIPIKGGLVKGSQLRLEELSSGVNSTPKRAETKIAEEIREQREREEELKKMREEIKLRASVVSENILQKSLSLTSNTTSNTNIATTTSTTTTTTTTTTISNNSNGNASSISPQSGSHLPNGGTCNNSNNNNGRVSPAPSDLSSGSSFVSVDSLENIGMKSPEKIKVKPYLDSDYNNVTYKVLNESPIEREIRLGREREEALKLEKTMLMAKKTTTNGDHHHQQQQEQQQQPVTKESSPTVVGSNNQQQQKPLQLKSVASPLNSSNKVASLKPVFGVAGSNCASNIQKVLATTRIQQEIEEQTQREIELREKGSIKTISQERTDVKVTKLGEIERITGKQQSPVSPVATTPDVESPEVAPFSSLNNHNHYQSSVHNSNNYHHHHVVHSTNLHNSNKNNGICGSNSSIHSSVSSLSNGSNGGIGNGSCNGAGGGFAKRKSSLPQVFGVGSVKNISMHKFISSKGKTASASNGFSSSFCPSTTDVDYPLRPPQILKGDKGIRRQVPAESKIQEELKEMKAREEELKWHRQRMMGKSQPNLATLINDETETEESGESRNLSVKEITNGNSFMKRTISIPNLMENNHNGQKPQVCHFGSGKKRNPLIEQWELKIQKVVNVNNN